MPQPRDREADIAFGKLSAALVLVFFLLVAATMFAEKSPGVGESAAPILALAAGLLALGSVLWMTASIVAQAQDGQWRSVGFRIAVLALLLFLFVLFLAVTTVVHITLYGFEPEVFQ